MNVSKKNYPSGDGQGYRMCASRPCQDVGNNYFKISREDQEEQPPQFSLQQPFSCIFCYLTFEDQTSLHEHVKILHRDKDKFSCTLCDFHCQKAEQLQCHSFLHKENIMLSCTLCNNHFRSVYRLKIHLKNHVREKTSPRFTCSTCGKDFQRMLTRKKHVLKHKGLFTCSCTVCEFSTDSLQNVMKQNHSFLCWLCHLSFSNLSGFDSHLTSVHKVSLENHREVIYIGHPHVEYYKEVSGEGKELWKKNKKEFLCFRCGTCIYSSALFKLHKCKDVQGTVLKCRFCYRRFKSKAVHKTHEELHLSKKPFQCSHCSYECHRLQNLQRHMLIHSREKNHLCTVCGLAFMFSEALSRHMDTHITEKALSCDVCPFQTSNPRLLTSHMAKHVTNIFSCNKCSYTSMRQADVDIHQNRVHKSGQDVVCKTCNLLLPSEKELQTHVLSHAIPVHLQYKCQFCDYTSYVQKNYIQHMRTHAIDKPFKCEICDYSSNRRMNLKMHLKRQHKFCVNKSVAHSCNLCNFSCERVQDYTNHMRIVHSVSDPFKCPVCSYSTNKQNLMKIHMEIHQPHKHVCSICSFKCKRKTLLNKHMIKKHSTHTGEEPITKMYKCAKCNFQSKHYASLRNHLPVHSGVVYPCDECSYTTFSQRNLNSHKRKHLREKPFKCPFCGYTSVRKNNYKIHMVRHIKERLFYCDECDYFSKSSSEVANHSAQKHGKHLIESQIKENVYSVCDFADNPSSTSLECEGKDLNMTPREDISPLPMASLANETIDSYNQQNTLLKDTVGIGAPHSVNASKVFYQMPGTEYTSASVVHHFQDFDVGRSSIILSSEEVNSRNCGSHIDLTGHKLKNIHCDKVDNLVKSNKLVISSNIKVTASHITGPTHGIQKLRRNSPTENSSNFDDIQITPVERIEDHFCSPALSQEGFVQQSTEVITGGFPRPAELPRGDSSNAVSQDQDNGHALLPCSDKKISYYESTSFISVSSGQDESLNFNSPSVKTRSINSGNCESNVSERFAQGHLPSPSFSTCELCKVVFQSTTEFQQHTMSKQCQSSMINSESHDQEESDALLTPIDSGGFADSTLNTSESIAKTYFCIRCSYTCNRPSVFKKHMLLQHHVEKAFSCSLCPYSAKREEDLRVHMITHDNSLIHSCSLCDYTSKRAPALRKHMKKKHTDITLFSCNLCNFGCSYEPDLKSHKRKFHETFKHFSCKLCQFSSERPGNFKEHMMSIHKVEDAFSCPHCTYSTHSWNNYRAHQVKHLPTRNFSCPTCGASFKGSSALNSHLRIHSSGRVSTAKSKCNYQCRDQQTLRIQEHCDKGEQKFICEFCQRSYSHSSSLYKHVSLIHKQLGRFKCPKCPYVASSPSLLKKHSSNVHAAGKEHHCSLCPFVCDHAVILSNHQLVHSSDFCSTFWQPLKSCTQLTNSSNISQCNTNLEDGATVCESRQSLPKQGKDQNRKFSCAVCSFSCVRLHELKIHTCVHTGEQPFPCNMCSFMCSKPLTLKYHKLKEHKVAEKKVKYQQTILSCPLCQYVCSKSRLLKYHILHKHKNENPESEQDETQSDARQVRSLSPSVDGSVGEGQDSISVRQHNKDEKTHAFSCSLCQYCTQSKGNLVAHMKLHKDRSLLCHFCDYTCRQKRELDRHLLTHSDTKPYSCKLCNYSCIQAASLKVHMMKHSGEKPIKCSHCEFRCRQKSTLRDHMTLHSSLRPFACGQCEYRAKRPSSLKVHLLSHSEEKPVSCSLCAFTCKHLNALRSHMKSHASDILPA